MKSIEPSRIDNDNKWPARLSEFAGGRFEAALVRPARSHASSATHPLARANKCVVRALCWWADEKYVRFVRESGKCMLKQAASSVVANAPLEPARLAHDDDGEILKIKSWPKIWPADR